MTHLAYDVYSKSQRMSAGERGFYRFSAQTKSDPVLLAIVDETQQNALDYQRIN